MDLPEKNNEIYFKGLIAMMEHLSEPWGIKDRQSRHIYMNKAAYLYTNTPLDFDIEGKLDNEFPAHWAEFSPEFIGSCIQCVDAPSNVVLTFNESANDPVMHFC